MNTISAFSFKRSNQPKFICFSIALLTMAFFGTNEILMAQGCVAIRGMGCSSANNNASLLKSGLMFNANARYFQSYKHFRGSHEEKERVENGTEVINDSYFLDLGLSYGLTNRLSVSVNLPILFYNRSSLYEHYGNSTTANPEQKRFATQASGIGDCRISLLYALIDPSNHEKLQINLGTGIKIPSGNEAVTDVFHRRATDGKDSTITRPVDQSIQLGDGGWGFNLELQTNLTMSHHFSIYGSGYYLFNPANVNSTLTRGTLTGVDPLLAYHSIADQYFARMGVNYLVNSRIQTGLGARLEGIPSKDVIGKSEGFRRPGYVIAVEPSVGFQINSNSISLSVPYALYRNRTKSVYDNADPTGNRHGDAAFADYSLNLSYSYKF